MTQPFAIKLPDDLRDVPDAQAWAVKGFTDGLRGSEQSQLNLKVNTFAQRRAYQHGSDVFVWPSSCCPEGSGGTSFVQVVR